MSSQAFAACPIYGSTYTLYRLSPLHFHGDGPVSQKNLRAHARRLQDVLKGDQLRGSAVELDQDDGLARAGTLQSCRWAWSNAAANDLGEDGTPSIDGLNVCEGFRVDIEYERTAYRALLLRGRSSGDEDRAGELHVPLLLLRMPALLRQRFLGYVSTTFDTRAEPLLIPSTSLARILEDFLSAAARNGADHLQGLVREVQLSLAFRVPTLRSLDITIAPDDVSRFVMKGRTKIPSSASQQGPFFAALAKYLSEHLAMDVNHEDLALSRIACGAFALGREGKTKIFPPVQRDASMIPVSVLLSSLLHHAATPRPDIS